MNQKREVIRCNTKKEMEDLVLDYLSMRYKKVVENWYFCVLQKWNKCVIVEI